MIYFSDGPEPEKGSANLLTGKKMIQPTAVSGISRLMPPGDDEQRDAAEEEEDDDSEGASTQVSFQIHFFRIVSRDDVSFLCSLRLRSAQ